MLNKSINYSFRKIIIASLILLVLLFFGNIKAEATIGSKPDIRVDRGYMQPVKNGEKFSLPIKISNNSAMFSIATGKVTISVPDSLTLLTDTNIFYIANTGIPVNGFANFDIPMKASEKLTGESVSVGITIEYQYWGLEGLASATDNYTLIIPTKVDVTKETQPIIQIVRNNNERLKANKIYNIDLEFRNLNKDISCDDVKISFASGQGYNILSRVSSKYIDKIKNDDPYETSIKIQTDKELDKESTELTINLSYSYKQGGNVVTGTSSDVIRIPLQSNKKEEDKKNGSNLTPNIIITKYDYGKTVEAGKDFKLNLKFKNTSKKIAVKNIVMSLNTGDGVSVASSSNSAYFESLAPLKVEPFSINLKAWEEAKNGASIITVNFSYEYLNKNDLSKGQTSETISIPIQQPDRFELSKVNISEGSTVGNETTISIPYINKGKSTVSNIVAYIKGKKFDSVNNEVWVGNCSSGSNGSIDFIVTPNEAGEINGKIIVKYESANLEQKEKKYNFKFNAENVEMPEMPENPTDDVTTESDKGSYMIYVYIVIAIVVVAAIIVFIRIISKRAKKKREERLKHMYDWALKDDKEDDK